MVWYTLNNKGQGIATVLATGVNTEMGKIGKALQSVELEETPLQKETGRLVRNLAFIGLFMCALVVIVYGLTRGQGEVDSRALTFTTLIIANLGLIFVNRSWSRTVLATLRSPNTALWWVTGGRSRLARTGAE